MRLPSSTAIQATDSIDRASNSWSGALDFRRATTAAWNFFCCFGLTPGSRSHDQTRSITSSIKTLSLRPPDLAHSENSFFPLLSLHSRQTATRLFRSLVDPRPERGIMWSISAVSKLIASPQYKHLHPWRCMAKSLIFVT